MIQNGNRMLDRRRLSDAWMKWHLIEWKQHMGEKEISIITNSELEYEIEKYLPRMRESFTKKWSSIHHTDNCMAEGNIKYSNMTHTLGAK